jgi:hypothetical protein
MNREEEMQIERLVGHAPQVTKVGRDIFKIKGPCVGCADCGGLCAALLELMTLPDAVLHRGRPV